MSFYVIPVKENSYEIFDYLIEGINKAKEYNFPAGMTSPHSKAKHFKKNHPEFHKIPNSLLKGFFKFGIIKSDGMIGLRLRPHQLHIWGLGVIHLDKTVQRAGSVKQISLRPTREIILHGMGKIGSNEKIVLKNYETSDINRLVWDDPIFRYLKVNGVFAEYGHKKACLIRDVIAHLENNPNMTRRQLESLGIRGDKVWDLVVNYQKSLDVWLRAGSKPKECNVLSKLQFQRKAKTEWSLSDHLSKADIDAGNLKKHSFDSMTYEALRSDRFDFYN